MSILDTSGILLDRYIRALKHTNDSPHVTCSRPLSFRCLVVSPPGRCCRSAASILRSAASILRAFLSSAAFFAASARCSACSAANFPIVTASFPQSSRRACRSSWKSSGRALASEPRAALEKKLYTQPRQPLDLNPQNCTTQLIMMLKSQH